MNVLALNLQALHARAAADIRSERDRSLALIQQTVAQLWPRCGCERIDGATVWLSAGFSDAEVVAWLEAGVYTAAAAVRLALAGVDPREVGGPAPPRPARDCDCHLMPRRGREYGAGGNSNDLPVADCQKCDGLGVVPGEVDVTLGLAFTRGDVDADGVLRLRRPAREVPC